MPTRKLTGDMSYHLIAFDEQGRERRESDGSYLSETVTRMLSDQNNPISDVFVASHGWKGDMPAAIEQYDSWFATMAAQQADRQKIRQLDASFAPLVVGLHWPSLPWGDETMPAGGSSLLSADGETAAPLDERVAAYAGRIADTPKAREAIRTVLEAADRNPSAASLSPAVREAYHTLYRESGLQNNGVGASPGQDQAGFDPDTIVEQARADAALASASLETQLLGFADTLRNAVLMPLRQLSFWKMKDRARRIGETGGRDLLNRWQQAASGARTHLMGHSFGSIVVSAAVAGDPKARALARPVDSMVLVQGALSLWSFTDRIPDEPGQAGYFHRIVQDRLVSGPLLTTRSTHDTAVGHFYPLGARIKQQYTLGPDGASYPLYGGIGAYGIQGVSGAVDMAMLPANGEYAFRGGQIYNLDASSFIAHGGGLSGAHSDIAHAEVAHAYWEAIAASLLRPPAASRVRGRPDANPGLLSADDPFAEWQSGAPASERSSPDVLERGSGNSRPPTGQILLGDPGGRPRGGLLDPRKPDGRPRGGSVDFGFGPSDGPGASMPRAPLRVRDRTRFSPLHPPHRAGPRNSAGSMRPSKTMHRNSRWPRASGTRWRSTST